MAVTEADKDPSLLVSSAPLGWPNLVVERRFFRINRVIDVPEGYREHRILIWDEPVVCTLLIGGKSYVLDSLRNATVVVPARTAFHATPRTPVRFTKLLIEEEFVDASALEAMNIGTVRLLPAATDSDADMRAIAYLLTEAVTGHQPLDDAMVAMLAREAAIHLVCNYAGQRLTRPEMSGRIPTAKLVALFDFVGANLDKPLPVERLAREAGISEAHFSRAFAKSTGRTPHAYVMGRRIAKAAHLLRNSALSIDQIASQCGFHDQAHMSHRFKIALGMTPRAYRTEPATPLDGATSVQDPDAGN